MTVPEQIAWCRAALRAGPLCSWEVAEMVLPLLDRLEVLNRELGAEMAMKLPPPKRDTHTITVPIPPSVNNLFRTAGRMRYKTREYREWIEATKREFSRLTPATVLPVGVRVVLTGKVNRARDVDNVIKPLIDSLVNCGVIPNDNLKHVDWVDAWYEPGEGEPRVVVTVCEPNQEGK